MTKKNLFQTAIKKVEAQNDLVEQSVQNASDMKNWVVVHATRHLPQELKTGEYAIPTTAMVTDFEIPRSTVHVTLNHVVTSHLYGNWDDASYVIIAPYNDVVAKNGNPEEVSALDTWFQPNPDTGLVLPAGTKIVRPASDLPDGQLVAVRGNEIVYKNIDFTPAEENVILGYLPWDEKAKYDMWAAGEVPEFDKEVLLSNLGDVGRKLYENAKDKQAFWRGIFANDRQAILATYVRNIAADIAMQDMGYQKWYGVGDLSPVAAKVESVAMEKGISATQSNKGHGNSLESKLEAYAYGWGSLLVFGDWVKHDKHGLLAITDSLEHVEDFLNRDSWHGGDELHMVQQALVTGKPIDFASVYKKVIENHKKSVKNRINAEFAKTPAGQKYLKSINELPASKPNLDKTLQRWAAKYSDMFEAWRNQIKTLPGYDKFIGRMKNNLNTMAVQKLVGDRGNTV